MGVTTDKTTWGTFIERAIVKARCIPSKRQTKKIFRVKDRLRRWSWYGRNLHYDGPNPAVPVPYDPLGKKRKLPLANNA
jgi:hypothetical protein